MAQCNNISRSRKEAIYWHGCKRYSVALGIARRETTFHLYSFWGLKINALKVTVCVFFILFTIIWRLVRCWPLRNVLRTAVGCHRGFCCCNCPLTYRKCPFNLVWVKCLWCCCVKFKFISKRLKLDLLYVSLGLLQCQKELLDLPKSPCHETSFCSCIFLTIFYRMCNLYEPCSSAIQQ